MPEEFIGEIYKKAELLPIFKLILKDLNRRDTHGMGLKIKKIKATLDEVINEMLINSPEDGESLKKIVKMLPMTLNDPVMTARFTAKGVIPLLERYCENFLGGIDVSEGKWQLLSSLSGFLTVKNIDKGIYLHSLEDPLTEAYDLADSFLLEDVFDVYILGGGLGYLPYVLYKKTFGAVKIHVFEKDDDLVNFAYHYGMYGYIPEDVLSIEVQNDSHRLTQAFNKAVSGEKGKFIYVSDYMPGEFEEEFKTSVRDYTEVLKSLISNEPYYGINYRFNRLNAPDRVEEVTKKIKIEECLIVAAGPSLNDYMDFVKNSMGKRTIIAVSTVLKKLLKEGIKPDFVVIGDPYESLYDHLEGIEEETKDLTLVLESLSYWKFADAWKGKKYRVFGASYKKTKEEASETGSEYWELGGTVSSLGIELGVRLGSRRVYMTGLDLSFPENKHYADSALTEKNNQVESAMKVLSVDGGDVSTVPAFDQFRRDIEGQISKYPDVKFINLSRHGAYIKGTVSE